VEELRRALPLCRVSPEPQQSPWLAYLLISTAGVAGIVVMASVYRYRGALIAVLARRGLRKR
jgi:hypothetical protein